VTSRPPPTALSAWAQAELAPDARGAAPELVAVAGDASNRRYFRTRLSGVSYILVDSPPATEKNEAFLRVRGVLAAAGVRVPALHGADLGRGYLALEDLGDRLLLAELDADSVEGHYRRAMEVLLRIAAIDIAAADLPPYAEALLREELGRFSEWFVEALLEQPLAGTERQLLRAAFDCLVDSALEPPRVLVHRDFHSRNLMIEAGGELAVIDFQDAVAGPVTYDLASLLRDCYIRWPREAVERWALAYRERLQASGLPGAVAPRQFLRWFDLMGLQRHIKVLGTFARLYLRDGKKAYLDDLPLVTRYVLETSGRYAAEEPALGAFHDWFESRLSPLLPYHRRVAT